MVIIVTQGSLKTAQAILWPLRCPGADWVEGPQESGRTGWRWDRPGTKCPSQRVGNSEKARGLGVMRAHRRWRRREPQSQAGCEGSRTEVWVGAAHPRLFSESGTLCSESTAAGSSACGRGPPEKCSRVRRPADRATYSQSVRASLAPVLHEPLMPLKKTPGLCAQKESGRNP